MAVDSLMLLFVNRKYCIFLCVYSCYNCVNSVKMTLSWNYSSELRFMSLKLPMRSCI